MARIVQSLVLASMAALGHATFNCAGTYCPTYTDVKHTLVDGGCGYANFLTEEQVSNITMDVSVRYTHPAFQMNADMPFPYNNTCGLGNLSCPSSDYYVSPGMNISTVSTRPYAMSSPHGHLSHTGATISFNMDASKKYTVLFMECFTADPSWGGMKSNLFWGEFNMQGTGTIPSTTQQTSMRAKSGHPLNPLVSAPNTYVYQVWEHDADLTNLPFSPAYLFTNAGSGSGSWFSNAGFNNAKLRAVNWMRVYGNCFSTPLLWGTPAASFIRPDTYYSSNDHFCFPTTTTTTSVTGGATQTSFGNMKFQVKLLTHCTLAMSLMLSYDFV